MKRLPLAAVMAAFFVFLVWFVSVRQAALFLIGIGMGSVLAGARFGFTTGWRRLIEQRDPSGVLAQLFLLALAAAVSMPLLAAFPTDLAAALGPPSISLLVGAFVFGAAMQVADGCGSGTLYKAGMGTPLNMAILPIFAFGSFLGSVQLDQWLQLGAVRPVGLVAEYGPLQAFLLTLGGLAVLGIAAVIWSGKSTRWFDRKLFIGAILLAVLAVLNLVVAGQPWGVVYGFGLWFGKIATVAGVFDPATNPFWSQPVNMANLSQSVFMDVTSITNIGILAGALYIAARKASSTPSKPLTGKQWIVGIVAGFLLGYSSRLAFGCNIGAMVSGISTGSQASTPSKPLTGKQWIVGIVAGFLLGYSSRLAFGCNIGAMVSGISTGSLHGWIWVPMAFLGSLIGVRVRRHFQF